MAGVPYVLHGAVVQGRAAVGLAEVLTAARDADLLVGIDADTKTAISAVLQAAQAAQRLGLIAVPGNAATSATRDRADGARSEGDLLSVEDVMARFGVKERQARNIAAGIGVKVAGRWLVNAAAVAAELERRGAA